MQPAARRFFIATKSFPEATRPSKAHSQAGKPTARRSAMCWKPAACGSKGRPCMSAPSPNNTTCCRNSFSVAVSGKSQDPKGKCPICGMDLVPVMKKGAAMHDHASHSAQMPPMPGMPMEGGATNSPETPAEFIVPVERQQQIGVTYAAIEKHPLN